MAKLTKEQKVNLKAMNALLNVSPNPIEDIAEMLESEHPISNSTRKMLAAAIRGAPTDDNYLKFKTVNSSSYLLRSVITLSKHMKAARQIELIRADCKTDREAIEAYSKKQENPFNYAEYSKRLTQFRYMARWARLLKITDNHGFNDDILNATDGQIYNCCKAYLAAGSPKPKKGATKRITLHRRHKTGGRQKRPMPEGFMEYVIEHGKAAAARHYAGDGQKRLSNTLIERWYSEGIANYS